MTALLWKECRENLKWVSLPTLLILVPIVGLLGLQSLMDFGLSFYVSLVAALFGAVLGFVQVFPEAHGDKRSLLLHRPLSPTRIFLGKTIAGVGLYLLGLGIPVAFLVGMAATPGHIAKPFSWSMALPLIADVLTGVVYYFGGMLAAQRQARWYGSKCLGLAAALLCSILVWTLPEFRHALLAIVIVGGVEGVAAWGSLMAGGAYAPQPRLARISLAVTFLMGLSTLSFLGNYYIFRWLEPHSNYTYSLDRQGRVLVVHFTAGELSVTDFEGRTPPELEGVRQDDYHALEEMSAPYVYGARARLRTYRSWNRFHIEHRNESRPANEDWFYVPDQGRLLGYNRGTKRWIGSFGPDGFVPPDRQPKDRFKGWLYQASNFPKANTPDYLAFPGAVYRVDFRKRTVQTLFVPHDGETVLWTDRWKIEKENRSLAFVGTDKSFYVLDETGRELFSAGLARDLENYQVWRVGRLENPQRYWVWYEPMCYLELEILEKMPAYVVEYGTTGRELVRKAVPPRPGGARPTGPREPFNEPSFTPALAGLVTPPAETAVLVGTTQTLLAKARGKRDTETELLLPFLLFTTQFFIPGVRWDPGAHAGLVFGFAALTVFSALLCALACLLLARRYAFSRGRCMGWSMMGFFFGWEGLVLLLALLESPACIPCPKCRKLRVVTSDTCEHCGAAHAAPEPDGTEIFESTAGAMPHSQPIRRAGFRPR
jgi:hypothetical protein